MHKFYSEVPAPPDQLMTGLVFDQVPVDFRLDFQTPVPVCNYMASLVPATCRTILEPTPGVGNLVRALTKKNPNFRVTAAEDYFLIDPELTFDCVVMNPPFSSKSAFVENMPVGFDGSGMRFGYTMLKDCMRKSPNVIALMPWFTISDSDVRLRFLRSFGLVILTALPRKTFKYARIQTVVIQLCRGYQGKTEFKVFDF